MTTTPTAKLAAERAYTDGFRARVKGESDWIPPEWHGSNYACNLYQQGWADADTSIKAGRVKEDKN